MIIRNTMYKVVSIPIKMRKCQFLQNEICHTFKTKRTALGDRYPYHMKVEECDALPKDGIFYGLCTCSVFNLRSCHLRLTLGRSPLCINVIGTRGYKEMASILADQERPRLCAQMTGEGEGGGCGVSANDYSCAQLGAQINFGDLTPYLTYDRDKELRSRTPVQYWNNMSHGQNLSSTSGEPEFVALWNSSFWITSRLLSGLRTPRTRSGELSSISSNERISLLLLLLLVSSSVKTFPSGCGTLHPPKNKLHPVPWYHGWGKTMDKEAKGQITAI
jgi:hypothetical protein